jgi:hypothetical protein
MRAILLCCCAAGVLLTTPSIVPLRAATPTTDDEAALQQAEAMQDRWQGRHSYLYDDDYQPGAETVGERAADPRACVNEPVRLRRSDGSTVVRRFRRCQ